MPINCNWHKTSLKYFPPKKLLHDVNLSHPSAPATLNQRERASPDARPQRRSGRAQERDPLRALALRQETQQDRNPVAGQELHPDAGQRAGGDEEVGVVLVPRSWGADPLPASHSPCAPAPGTAEGTWSGQPR